MIATLARQLGRPFVEAMFGNSFIPAFLRIAKSVPQAEMHCVEISRSCLHLEYAVKKGLEK